MGQEHRSTGAGETPGKTNFYMVLELSPGASHNDILHAYTRLKQTYSGGSLASYSIIDDDSGDRILEEVEAAFDVLGNPAKRRKYDIEMGFETWAGSAEGKASESEVSKARPIEAGAPTIFSNASTPAAASEPQPRPGKPKLEAVPQAPSFEPNPDFERKIAECTEVEGSFLRALRIYRQLSVERMSQRTRIAPQHIATIEEESAEGMLPPVYLRGHVYMMCRELKLPHPDELARKFVQRMVESGKVPGSNLKL